MKNILFDENTTILEDSDFGDIFAENFGSSADRVDQSNSIIKKPLAESKELKVVTEAIDFSMLPGSPAEMEKWGGVVKESTEETDLDEAAGTNAKKQAEAQLDAVPGIDKENIFSADDEDSAIWKALDRALITAKRQQHANFHGNYPNIGLVGLPGVGKTSIVTQWAKARNVNLFMKPAPNIGSEDLMGIPAPDKEKGRAVMMPSGIFDELDLPNSVFFIDEFNRSRSDVRNALLTLISSHKIPDPNSQGQMRFLPNFLFTIAAINPASTSRGAQELDQADMGRFKWKDVTAANDKLLGYLRREYLKELQLFDADANVLDGVSLNNDVDIVKEIKGRLAIATVLLSDDTFEFNSVAYAKQLEDEDSKTVIGWNGNLTEPRQLTEALENCDGTKDSFLEEFEETCNNLDLDTVASILETYDEADDAAIDALLHDSESTLLAREKTPSQKARSLLKRQGKHHA